MLHSILYIVFDESLDGFWHYGITNLAFMFINFQQLCFCHSLTGWVGGSYFLETTKVVHLLKSEKPTSDFLRSVPTVRLILRFEPGFPVTVQVGFANYLSFPPLFTCYLRAGQRCWDFDHFLGDPLGRMLMRTSSFSVRTSQPSLIMAYQRKATGGHGYGAIGARDVESQVSSTPWSWEV